MRRVWAAMCLFLFCAGLEASEAPAADAAAQGDSAAVRQLLRQGADPNAAQGDGMTALHWAAHTGDVGLARMLLYSGAGVGAGTRIGHYTPLHLACRGGHLEMVRLLLEAKSDAGARVTHSGATPLHLAAEAGNPAVVEALVEAGAEVNAREASWEQTPLIFAAARGRVDAVRMLLKLGADPALHSRAVDVAQREEADRAAETRLSEFLAQFREKEGGGSNWTPKPSQVQAAIQASREIQRRWPDVPRPGEDAPAAEAVQEEPAGQQDEAGTVVDGPHQGEEDSVSVGPGREESTRPAGVVKYNAEGEPIYQDSVTDENEDEAEPRPLSYGQMVGTWGGLTPLLHAVRQGHLATALALLEGGAAINQPSAGDQTTPLLLAAINGQFDLALVLLERGADPNLVSRAGTGPLFAVLERTWAPRASYSHPTEHQQQEASHLQVIEALLSAGADPNARLNAHLWYMEYTFQVLRRAGIHLAGATPFWRASQALDVEAMRLLKDHGADPTIPNRKPPQRRRPPDLTQESPPPAQETEPAQASEGGAGNPEKTNLEAAAEDSGTDQEEDHLGLPPVPVGGPFLYPIHTASGAGYGQSFAGNAHRYVPDNWLKAVRFLVEECGADVNLRDANGYTALHHAASRGDNALVRYLVERGADVTVVSRKGQTTADMANGPIQRLSPFPETVALLERLGSKNNHNCVSC